MFNADLEFHLRTKSVKPLAGPTQTAFTVTSRRDPLYDFELTVQETGPGIAAEDQLKLFQAFSRLTLATPKEGTGLGLALVAALCRSAGGNVSVKSDGHHGSCFHVRLPLALATPPEDVTTQITPTTSHARRRILVVDDNPLVRQLFRSFLTMSGADCEVAREGEEALAVLHASSLDAVGRRYRDATPRRSRSHTSLAGAGRNRPGVAHRRGERACLRRR